MLEGWDTNKCIQLRLDHTKVAEDLTDFPVLINLGATSGQNSYDTTAIFDELGYDIPNDLTFYGNAGNKPNDILWALYDPSDSASIINDNLHMSFPPVSPGNYYVYASSNFVFEGNFSVTLEYSIDTLTVPTTETHAATLEALSFYGTQFSSIHRYRTSASQGYTFASSKGWETLQSYSTFTGKMRIEKVGTSIKKYYWNGSSWTLKYTTTTMTDTYWYIRVGASCPIDSTVISDITSLTIDYGTVLWLENTIPTRKKIAIYDPGYQEHMVETVDDAFVGTNGDSPNTSLWLPYNNNPSATSLEIHNSKLRFSTDTAAVINDAWTVYKVSGNFDVQVDFTTVTETTTNIWLARLMATTVQNNIDIDSIGMSLRYESAKYWYGESTVASSWDFDLAATSATSGKFRLQRIGDIAYSYYWGGSDWILLHTRTAFSTDDVYIELQLRSTTSQTLVTDFYAFKLNYGAIDWNGEIPNYELKTRTGTAQQCYCEIDGWDQENQSAQLWVKVPKVLYDQPTDLYLYYDISKDSNNTYIGGIGETPAQSVWSNGYVSVYHLNQDPTSTTIDSLGNNDLISSGGMTTDDSVTTMINKGIDFDGANDRLYNDSFEYLNASNVSVESLVYIHNLKNFGNIINHAWATQGSFLLMNTINQAVFGIVNSSQYNIAIDISNTTWYYLGGTFDRASRYVRVYANEADRYTLAPASSDLLTTSQLALGSNVSSDSSASFDGYMEEIRISNVTRSPYWMKASYFSCFDNLITYSDAYIYYIDGYVKQDNNPVQRKVYLYERSTGKLMDSTTSDTDGYYYLKTTNTNAHNVICLDAPSGKELNDLIASKIYPSA